MTQVKIFSDRYIGSLESQINSFLYNKNIELVDIKMSYGTTYWSSGYNTAGEIITPAPEIVATILYKELEK